MKIFICCMWWWRLNCGSKIFIKFHGCKNLKLVSFDLFSAWLLLLILVENECLSQISLLRLIDNLEQIKSRASSDFSPRWGEPVLNPVKMFKNSGSRLGFWVMSISLEFYHVKFFSHFKMKPDRFLRLGMSRKVHIDVIKEQCAWHP